MTRLLHVLAPGEVGGAERVVEVLSLAQLERGHEARIAAIVEEGGARTFVRRMEESPVPVTVVRAPHRSYWREALQLKRTFESLTPDLVHTHGYHADVVGGMTALWAGLPRVSTVHGFTAGGWKNRVYEVLQRRTLAGFDEVVAVSDTVARRLRSSGVSPDRIRVIRNAWQPSGELLPRGEARDELGLPPGEFVIGWVGRLSHEKGPDVALRALDRLESSAILSMVGTGREGEGLRDQAEELGLADRVRFQGLVPDAHRLFPAFDVLMLSSRTEGTPMVVFEAVAAGVPVVSTSVGGVTEIVGPEEAHLVPPEDPDALASAIDDVRASAEAARQRARRARRRVEREHSVESWVEEYDRAYDEARSQGGGG